MEIININERAVFNEQFAPQVLVANAQCKIPLICMNPGQEIPAHPSATGVFYIVKGSAVMTINGQEHTVKAGNMIFIEKGLTRGIRALETLTMFAVHING